MALTKKASPRVAHIATDGAAALQRTAAAERPGLSTTIQALRALLPVLMCVSCSSGRVEKVNSKKIEAITQHTGTVPVVGGSNGGTASFEVGKVWYNIPIAYLSPENMGRPFLDVTYPTLEPGSTSGKGCVTWFSSIAQNACAVFDFSVTGPGLSRQVIARNARLDPASTISEIDEYGYKVTWTQPTRKFGTFTRGAGPSFVYFFCVMQDTSSRAPDGVCSDIFELSDGNSIQMNFPYHIRGQLPAVEAKVEHLMANFRQGDA